VAVPLFPLTATDGTVFIGKSSERPGQSRRVGFPGGFATHLAVLSRRRSDEYIVPLAGVITRIESVYRPFTLVTGFASDQPIDSLRDQWGGGKSKGRNRQTAIKTLCDILNGVEQVHSAGVVHRDLKPANIFLTTEYRARTGDCGSARFRDAAVHPWIVTGTAIYRRQSGTATPKDDKFAFGWILWEIMRGLPWTREKSGRLSVKDAIGQLNHHPVGFLKELDGWPLELSQLFKQCVLKNGFTKLPDSICPAEQLLNSLQKQLG
jgi:serine/threonine protein kinase